ncbi:response regulator [Streptomyces sp. 71268]|uniref:response regulator n=1 Tax=Streptomyces sp. 71268 TaxID=3002640 RepID=UPI0023F744CB|nr:response regulator [Streptomyces sp. 71268]WEV26416.1 response regulator [Streptomyces sp. 71268]
MGELRPLADDLSDECRQFAVMLRELFAGLGISVRRYAARRYRDPGTISRYLSGTRVPPWEFVLDLLTDLAAARSVPTTPDAVELLRERHRAAIHTSGSVGHAVEVLQNQLADADRAARSATLTEDALGRALLERQHRIADLEVRLGQLEAAWAAERARVETLEQELACPDHDREQLLHEQDRLRQEVRRLTDELEEVRRRGMLAEDRCQLLERQLAAVEAQGVASGETDEADEAESVGLSALTNAPPYATAHDTSGRTATTATTATAATAATATAGRATATAGRAGAATTTTAAAGRTAQHPAAAYPPPPAAAARGAGPRPKILIVDDQRDNLLAMEAVLATLGQELVAATSGREALRALLDHDDFAVILLDVQMPEMDGYETAAQIKRRPRNRDIPLLFLTAMGADPEHSSRGYAAGAVDYIAKPVDPWALRAKVSTFTEIFLERRHYSRHATTPYTGFPNSRFSDFRPIP